MFTSNYISSGRNLVSFELLLALYIAGNSMIVRTQRSFPETVIGTSTTVARGRSERGKKMLLIHHSYWVFLVHIHSSGGSAEPSSRLFSAVGLLSSSLFSCKILGGNKERKKEDVPL
uniref:Uncharacterized protein n=1 Tax=Corethron hystrix TaxID=216773 RepID=A0A6U5J0D9_9STRA